MKALLAVALAVALAVPAVAIADRGSSDRRARVSSHAAKKLEKQRLKTLRSTRARVRHHAGDEREVTGRIVSLSPVQVGTLVCHVRPGTSLAGFGIGDRVELTCDLVAGRWLLRKLEHDDDDEREVRGRIASLAPLTVGTLTCRVPAGVSLAGFAVGDLVELKCDRVGADWVLRKLEREDDEDDDRSGRGDADDDDDDEDDEDDDDHSGPGGGDDDDDDSGSDRDDD